MRFLEFFAANICNPHTRRAYSRAAEVRRCRRIDQPRAPARRFSERLGTSQASVTTPRVTATSIRPLHLSAANADLKLPLAVLAHRTSVERRCSDRGLAEEVADFVIGDAACRVRTRNSSNTAVTDGALAARSTASLLAAVSSTSRESNSSPLAKVRLTG